MGLASRSTLTPTLSREREREREHVGPVSRVFVGEGWGEGRPADWLNILARDCLLCATPSTPPLCGETFLCNSLRSSAFLCALRASAVVSCLSHESRITRPRHQSSSLTLYWLVSSA